MLFQNLLRLEKVGKSGNADQHYANDWLDITVETGLDRFGDAQEGLNAADATKDYCNFPSVRVVEIFYEKINTKEKPQYMVRKMQQYSTND